jgi:energy-coupling factor transporter ATP-binding protein EcfA2
MKKIKSIDILNFKVFRHREYFELNGRNLLVYGTNGSGKSSLFWSLYTFFQSSTKPNHEIQKYFDPEDERNLRNIFSKPTDPSFIKVTFIDETEKETMNTIGVSIEENPHYDATPAADPVSEFFKEKPENSKNKYLKTYLLNTVGDADVITADSASDFINYRLLLNFYNASHRDKTDLIYVFERDIFPFFKNQEGEGLAENYYFLIENPPRVQRDKKLEEEKKRDSKTLRLAEATIKSINEEYEIKRTKFNKDLDALFNDINKEGNQFLKRHFTNNQDKYRFEVAFYQEDVPDGQPRELKKTTFDLRLNEFGQAESPYITLNVWQKDNGGTDKDIWRPHSFLNEAKLTQLALSIRLAALKIKLQKARSIIQTLVLDDLLISLDMSNRLIVLNIILEEFKNYQLIILTHDKGFFDLVSLKTKSNEKEWVKLEFYDTEDEGNPLIRISEDYLVRAKKYLAGNSFDLAAVMLRKKAENILKVYLDPDLKHLTIFDSKDTLSEFFKKAKKHPYNLQYDKLSKMFSSDKIQPVDIDSYDITNGTIDAAITGDKRTHLMGFRINLFQQSKEHLQWLADSAKMRADLLKMINDMEDLSGRILNPGSHTGAAPLFKKEIEDAIKIIEDIHTALGITI